MKLHLLYLCTSVILLVIVANLFILILSPCLETVAFMPPYFLNSTWYWRLNTINHSSFDSLFPILSLNQFILLPFYWIFTISKAQPLVLQFPKNILKFMILKFTLDVFSSIQDCSLKPFCSDPFCSPWVRL